MHISAVMSVGGDGTEMKSWQEVKEMRETAAQKGRCLQLELLICSIGTSTLQLQSPYFRLISLARLSNSFTESNT